MFRREIVFTVDGLAIGVGRRRGTLRLFCRELFSPQAVALAREFVARVLPLEQVAGVRIRFRRACGEIDFDPAATSARELLLEIAAALTAAPGTNGRTDGGCVVSSGRPRSGILVCHRAAAQTDREQRLRRLDGLTCDAGEERWAEICDLPETPALAHGPKRLLFRGLAVVSFGVTCFALAVPAIPTPPFLAATIYFAVRSSPAMHDWLARSRIFGRMLLDWEKYRAVRMAAKLKSISITVGMMSLFILVLHLRGSVLIVVLSMTALKVTAVLMLPTVRIQPVDAEKGHGKFA